MSLRLGDTAPNFKAKTTAGEIDFHEYLGNGWAFCFRILLTILLYAPQNWEDRFAE